MSEFYVEKRTRRGYRNLCKRCTDARNKTYEYNYVPQQPSAEVKKRSLDKHRDERNAWLREYSKRPSRVEWRRNYLREHPEQGAAWYARRKGACETMSDEDKFTTKCYRQAIRRDPCYYCGQRREHMHDDHYIPIALGGTDHWWNLVRACEPCNERKGNKPAPWSTTDFCEVPKR